MGNVWYQMKAEHFFYTKMLFVYQCYFFSKVRHTCCDSTLMFWKDLKILGFPKNMKIYTFQMSDIIFYLMFMTNSYKISAVLNVLFTFSYENWVNIDPTKWRFPLWGTLFEMVLHLYFLIFLNEVFNKWCIKDV